MFSPRRSLVTVFEQSVIRAGVHTGIPPREVRCITLQNLLALVFFFTAMGQPGYQYHQDDAKGDGFFMPISSAAYD